MRKAGASGYGITVAMLGMVILPAALTLHTVRVGPLTVAGASNPTPYGYTASLLLFLVPCAAIALWFLPSEGLKISRQAFAWSLGLLFSLGGVLDFFFAKDFFRYPNANATLGLRAPALGGGVPIEEYCFYFFGFMTVLLLYIWLDEYWLSAYTVPANADERICFERLLRFHPESLVLAVVLVAAGLLYGSHAGRFPGYFVFLVLGSLLPSSALLPTARPVINWRALSLTMFLMLVTSLMWEVTLALPYGWWEFQDRHMLGIYVTAWSGMPVEEVYVWIGVTYSSVIVYEIAKRWKSSGRRFWHAMAGGEE